MELISNNKELLEEFKSLLGNYDYFSCLSAWAGGPSISPLSILKYQIESKNIEVEKMIIGTAMYQTHPDFIEEFYQNKAVRFKKPNGNLFHPKMYLFYSYPKNNEEKIYWTMLIGSANFTNAAFSRNDEVMMKINFSEGGNKIFAQAMSIINQYWEGSKKWSIEDVENYRERYNIQKDKVKDLNENYEDSNNSEESKSLMDSSICQISWKSFISKVKFEKKHSFEDRLYVLNKSRDLFESVSSFAELNEEDRHFIAGAYSKDKMCGIFGHMQAALTFNNISKITPLLAEALDCIPLEGEVLPSDYENFIEKFSQVENSGIATGTRLLAMKRPDYFICLNSKNKKLLCSDFGISESITLETYWNSIIKRIQNSVLYNTPEPQDLSEKAIWNARVAFLDVLYLEGDFLV